MSLPNRPFSRTSLYDATTTANTNASSTASQQPSARFLPPHILTSRIAEKQAEYENLSQLRDLSAALAAQMESLESKLQCLADGTEGTLSEQPPNPQHVKFVVSLFLRMTLIEGVAEVLANWQNVFRAINLATGICWWRWC